MSNPKVTLEIVHTDPDYLEVVVAVESGTFSGAVALFTDEGTLAEAAGALSGFPTGGRDRRELRFGALTRDWAGGAAALDFRCVDRSGHALVAVTLESGDEIAGVRQQVAAAFQIEAASVDRFVNNLGRIASRQNGIAVLNGIG